MDDEEPRPARVQLSLTQVLAGAVAAMVGSLVASRLGLAGTVIGAAVISVVATVLTAINVSSMTRVRERARLTRLAAARSRLDQRRRAEFVTPDLPTPEETADDTADLAEIAELEAEDDAEGHGRFTVADRRGYHWSVIAGVSALVFVLAMVGITVVEKVTGKAISCSLGRDCEDPTTIPLPGQNPPSTSPTPSPSAVPSTSRTPTPTPSPTPSDTVSPTPTPSVSVSVSPSPSASEEPSASPSSS